MEHLLEVKNLSVSIDGPSGEVQAVRDVSFSLKKGEVLAIVGESGCGKSVLCKSIMKLLPPSAKIKEGSISAVSYTHLSYTVKPSSYWSGRTRRICAPDHQPDTDDLRKLSSYVKP